jgi:hypothetical protein
MTLLDQTAAFAGESSTRLLRKARDEPLTQGDLDGLCGVYVIINAMRRLCPEVGKTDCERLFTVMMKSLRKHDAGQRSIATSGLHLEQVLDLSRVVCSDLQKRYGIDLRFSVPKNQPKRANVDVVWRLLNERLSITRVAILGMQGKCDHWTLAVSATNNLIRLADSDGMKVLRRADCRSAGSNRHICLSQRHMVFVRRVKALER